MKSVISAVALTVALTAETAHAEDFELRVIGGSVQLGGQIVISVRDDDKQVPDGATCEIELPPPYAEHVQTVSAACKAFTLQQGYEPILDSSGYALPSTQVPYDLIVRDPTGKEVGRVTDIYPYNNQFSELRILVKNVRNPVSAGDRFDAVVLGAGKPIADSLLCRWNLYGPIKFEPVSENACTGTLVAQQPNGRDADFDVEIVNLTDMHAVGYAVGKMIVK